MGDNYGIGILSTEGEGSFRPILDQKYNETQPQISPGGRWMAYASDEPGKSEVYVRTFPEVNKGRWPVSVNGGDSPLWSRDGRELFYRNGEAAMAVSVKTGPGLSLGPPQTLFRGTYLAWSPDEPGTPWDVGPDGRFLMMKASPQIPHKINIVLNWFEELKQRVPTQ